MLLFFEKEPSHGNFQDVYVVILKVDVFYHKAVAYFRFEKTELLAVSNLVYFN